MATVIDGPNADFAMRILDARRRKNLSQEDLAELIGVNKRSISLYENGHSFPRGQTIRNLAKHLDVDARWLATGHVIETHQYLVSNSSRHKNTEQQETLEMIFIEEWKTLPQNNMPIHLPKFSYEPRYRSESSDLSKFTPVKKGRWDKYRATKYPGSIPPSPSFPAGSIFIFDAGLVNVDEIEVGKYIIFRFRGNENEPGLRRLVREPGLKESFLVPVDERIPGGAILLDEIDIEVIGIVVSQVIDRSGF